MTADERRPRAALVVNPVKADAPRLIELLQSLSEQADWAPPRILETSVDDPGQDATRTALAEGAAAVLVAGGDGTVRAVSEAMAGSDVPLSIVPSGTGNLLARNLGIALDDPAAAIDAVFHGEQRRVDIGWAALTRANGERHEHGFVVLAGIGLDAHMIANTRPGLKKSVGWVAYVDGAARALPGAKPFRIMYAVDNKKLHTVKVHSMLFANCGALPAGIALVPDASITDGRLDVAVIQARGTFGWVAVWRTVWWQNSVLRRTKAGRRVIELSGSNRSVRFLQGRDAEAATHDPAPVELDGDEFGEAVRIHCRIDPGALLMAVPNGHVISPA